MCHCYYCNAVVSEFILFPVYWLGDLAMHYAIDFNVNQPNSMLFVKYQNKHADLVGYLGRYRKTNCHLYEIFPYGVQK